jgi:hypothetical protein
MSTLKLDQWNRTSTILGAVVWLVVVIGRLLGQFILDDLSLILLLAFFVIVPLAINLATPDESRNWPIYGLIILSQPAAAIAAALSLVISTGITAGVLSIFWLLFTLAIAVLGAFNVWCHKHWSIDELTAASALIYLPIGALWFVSARFGIQPLGFVPLTVWLTAAHFHYITLAALVITGMIGRALQNRKSPVWMVYRVAAVGMIVNLLIVAAGITLTQLTSVRIVETSGSVLLALSLITISLICIRYILPETTSTLTQFLLIVSSGSVLLTMLAAAGYALGMATGAWTITISQMIVIHGWLNALGFGLCGLLGWRLREFQPVR